MSEKIILRVYEVIGSNMAVASDDGQKVYDQIATAISKDGKVELSFENIENLTSAFLNAAVGQLYGTVAEDKIRNSLTVAHIEPDDVALLKRVVETAKEYFRDPSRVTAARHNVLGDEDEE